MGGHLAANTPSVPTEGPTSLELADATDDVITVKSEVLGPWLEAGCHGPVEQRGFKMATVTVMEKMTAMWRGWA